MKFGYFMFSTDLDHKVPNLMVDNQETALGLCHPFSGGRFFITLNINLLGKHRKHLLETVIHEFVHAKV